MILGSKEYSIQLKGASANYSELLEAFAPRPITDDEQYRKTQEVIESLLSETELSEDAELYLHLLAMLMEAYDEEQKTVPELRGIERIQMLIEESELKQRDLLPIFRHESVISDILARRRKLTVAHIDQLASFFNLPHQLFFESSNATRTSPLAEAAA